MRSGPAFAHGNTSLHFAGRYFTGVGMKQQAPERKYSEEDARGVLLWISPLLATAIFFVIRLAGKDSLDTPQTVALCAFAFCIPLLAVSIALELEAIGMNYDEASRMLSYPIPLWPILGSSAFLLGLLSVFWHFHYLMAILFCFASAISFGVWVIATNRIEP
jgi:hypothetical protein